MHPFVAVKGKSPLLNSTTYNSYPGLLNIPLIKPSAVSKGKKESKEKPFLVNLVNNLMILLWPKSTLQGCHQIYVLCRYGSRPLRPDWHMDVNAIGFGPSPCIYVYIYMCVCVHYNKYIICIIYNICILYVIYMLIIITIITIIIIITNNNIIIINHI